MNPDAVYDALAHGSAEQRRALVDEWLPDDLKPAVLPLLIDDTPGPALVALGMAAIRYCNGANPEVGASLAQALHRVGVELLESGKAPGLQVATVSILAFQYAHASNLLGRSDAVIRFADEWIPFYERLAESQNLPSLKSARIAALLNLNRIDEAARALRDPRLRGNPANDIEVVRLQKKLDDMIRPITGTKDEGAPADASSTDANLAIERALGEFARGAAGDPAGREAEFVRIVERLNAPTGDLTNPENYRKLLEDLRQGEQFLTGGSVVESQWTIKRRVREATGIFLEKAPSPERIRASLAELESCLAWAREHADADLANDALWGGYLCHNRLREFSRAADTLLELRANLEARRAGISDPLERGGVFADYPHLFNALCEKLQQAGRTGDLLEAIEAAKGRGIADILTKKAARPIADADVYAAVRSLPALAAAHQFHYLTFHVDDERTYAVLVTKRGVLHSPAPVPLGRQAIRDAARHADPRDWGQPSDVNPYVRIANTPDVLSALVTWLQPLIDTGEIEAGDHVCYAADEDVANIPLHYLRFGGRALADCVSVSKIHGVFHLGLLLTRSPVVRPSAFFAIVVPTRQNVSQASWPRRKLAMWQPVEWLRRRMPGEVVDDAGADVGRVSTLPLTQRIVHFSTHGVFPDFRSPFDYSGIVLATDGELPDETAVAAAADSSAVLTPSKVLDTGLELAGSHVSLMACVSGLSREGRGGDALGLEWALIQAGATSVLASHWYISARQAAEFFERFYEHWIVDGLSRAAAHARAMQDLKRRHGDEHVDVWAAFSLVGDWR